jgi:DNA-binding protein H-NS
MKEKDMDELEQLHKQIADLQAKAQDIAIKRKEPVIEEMKAKIKLYGITAKELGFTSARTSTVEKTSSVAIKYKQGDNTWTGRGREPKFIVDHLASGGKIEELLVK